MLRGTSDPKSLSNTRLGLTGPERVTHEQHITSELHSHDSRFSGSEYHPCAVSSFLSDLSPWWSARRGHQPARRCLYGSPYAWSVLRPFGDMWGGRHLPALP